jgi:lipoprotein-anchoring transpeptidase ErfK/SrfK
MNIHTSALTSASLLAAALWIGSAAAAPLPPMYPGNPDARSETLMPGQAALDVTATPADLAPGLQRQVIAYPTTAAPGTVVIDTRHTYLYYVLGDGKAIRYGIGVGRDGFTWSGAQTVTRKSEWPDWTPPQEMIGRQPYLPRWMAGGEGNPLGARAIYLGSTVYRIHGTNAPATIGQRVSSGCIRMLNAVVIDLYGRVNIGTKIVVMPGGNDTPKIGARIASARNASAR